MALARLAHFRLSIARLLHKKAEQLLESAAQNGGLSGLLKKLIVLGKAGDLQPSGTASSSSGLRVRVRWVADQVCNLHVTSLLAYLQTILLAFCPITYLLTTGERVSWRKWSSLGYTLQT